MKRFSKIVSVMNKWTGGRFVGAAALVPAALVCSMIVAVEVLLATEAIGPAYERLDILAVERSE